jgi:chromosome segregation ATPase
MIDKPEVKSEAREFWVAEELSGKLHIFRENHQGGGLTKFVEYSKVHSLELEKNNLENKFKQLEEVFRHQCEELRPVVQEFTDVTHIGRRLSWSIVTEYRKLQAKIESLKQMRSLDQNAIEAKDHKIVLLEQENRELKDFKKATESIYKRYEQANAKLEGEKDQLFEIWQKNDWNLNQENAKLKAEIDSLKLQQLVKPQTEEKNG